MKTIGELLHDVMMGSSYDDPQRSTSAKFELEARFSTMQSCAVAERSQIALLRGQLAARDAALDAVLDLATNPKHSGCDSPGETILRRQFADLLTKHGVHPK